MFKNSVCGYRFVGSAILVSAGLFTACTFTSMRSIQRAPGFRSAGMHRVLVIGHFKDQALRKLFEEEFVRQWGRRGVQAASSLGVLPPVIPLSKEVVAPIANARGFDTVLVSRLLEKRRSILGNPLFLRFCPPIRMTCRT